MILTIDIGNSRTKWGMFNSDHTLLETGVFSNLDYPVAPPRIWAACHHALVACVADERLVDKISGLLAILGISARILRSTQSACGVENAYDQFSQLGVDRWAAIVAAWQLYKAPCLVVNAGTAVTLDAIAIKSIDQGEVASPKQGRFIGGLILPGLKLTQNSLFNSTAKLQYCILDEPSADLETFKLFATNTASAVQCGIKAAIVCLIKAMILELKMSYGEQIFCVISGGDAAIFADALDTFHFDQQATPIVLDPHLVLKGLLFLHDE